jgi:eukaryotic-like serine/threonine-protein kinase
MVGRTLGSYQIIEKLGEGGMGEVWRARDNRLGRFVAVKVLPADLARDADRRQRFEAEARAVGILNHPNIVAVYDVGTDGDQAYMVSELVEGESLRPLIRRGPLSPRKLTDLASQIAEGLAAAHGVGIVHRDLKPENIMVTRDGRAKILDFGLAKQIAKPAGDETATALLSQPGIVMGTVGYMSPEQVRGEPVDRRSDIFSFGCILYELATGNRSFQAGSAAEVLGAILKDDPPPIGNPALDAIVRRCLEKQPDQRFQSAADLAFALRSVSNVSGSQVALSEPKPVSRTKWLRVAVMAAVAVLLVAGGYLVRDRTTNQNVPEFERLTFRQGHISTARFTSDGQNVIYTANWEGGPGRTYLVTPGNPESRDLMMPENSQLLSISAGGDLALLVGPFDPEFHHRRANAGTAGARVRRRLDSGRKNRGAHAPCERKMAPGISGRQGALGIGVAGFRLAHFA